MLITWDLDSGKLNVGLGVNTSFVSELRAPVGSTQQVRIGFYRPTGTTTKYLDIGSDPQIEFIVKEAAGADRFDDAPIVPTPVFTRETVDALGNYFYVGYLDLSSPGVLKRLGVDNGFAIENFTIGCINNDYNRLSGRYFDIYQNATSILRFWFDVVGQQSIPPTDPGGGLAAISIAVSDTATVVAAAVAAALNLYTMGVVGTASSAAELVTFAANDYSFRGVSNAGTTGFAFTLITAGRGEQNTTDVSEYEFAAQIKYTADGPQVSSAFSLVVENSLYRSDQAYPSGTSGAFYRQGTVVCDTTEIVTVTFSSALPSADYHIIEIIIRYTGGGSPGYALGVLTIASKSVDGFVAYLNGDATADYALDYKVTL